MPDESASVPAARVVRWMALGVLVLLAVALYFADGLRLAPLSAAPPDTGAASTPAR